MGRGDQMTGIHTNTPTPEGVKSGAAAAVYDDAWETATRGPELNHAAHPQIPGAFLFLRELFRRASLDIDKLVQPEDRLAEHRQSRFRVRLTAHERYRVRQLFGIRIPRECDAVSRLHRIVD